MSNNRQQDGRKKDIKLALHAVINLLDTRFRLLLAFVVLHQQTRNRGAERGLPRLQRIANLIRGRGFVWPSCRQRKHAVGGVPELR